MKKKKIKLENLKKGKTQSHSDGADPKRVYRTYGPAVVSFLLLIAGIGFDYFDIAFFQDWIRIIWYGVAYIPVGFPVVWKGMQNIMKGEFFTEFLLMSIATIGAFAIGEYPEGVAVMLFYAVGEIFQDAAVSRAKGNIKALLDVRPDTAFMLDNGRYKTVHPEDVKVGSRIQVKVGEKIPLDGLLISNSTRLNTSALTGESRPVSVEKGDRVLSGSINLGEVAEVETTKIFKDSSVARIIELVQNASSRKSKTELFIRKFARIYTPIVVYAAIALTLVPYFIVENYVFSDWLYRALIFLVISCPCALVISIPLGYFGGLGAASKNGILFKGASYLDEITKINTLVMDKTGTVTKGIFKVSEVHAETMEEEEFLDYLAALEKKSTHPIAVAVTNYVSKKDVHDAEDVQEISGKGLVGTVDGKEVLAGNGKLMKQFDISYPEEIKDVVDSIVIVAVNNRYAGYVTVADELKEDAKEMVLALNKMNIKEIIMLSGDKDSITQKVARELNLTYAKGGLLPEDKLREVEELKKDPNRKIAFVGDGINDAPVLALSDIGIAMGGLGSDVAIETADVVIQTDQPSKIIMGIKIGNSTRNIVWQNIALAFGVKAIVLVMGAWGVATMWEAVFADVGVAFLAILNAVRLQNMNWK